MTTMTTEHQNYLRDLLERRSKRLSAKRDDKSQAEGALCAEIGKHFGLKPITAAERVITAKPKKPAEDRSHRLAKKPVAAPKKPAPAKPVVVAKAGAVAASSKPAPKPEAVH